MTLLSGNTHLASTAERMKHTPVQATQCEILSTEDASLEIGRQWKQGEALMHAGWACKERQGWAAK